MDVWNLISGELCRHHKLRKKSDETRYQVHSIIGNRSAGIMSVSVLDHYSWSVLLHVVTIEFLVLEDYTSDIILGHPWLVKHCPMLSWTTGEVLKWGNSFP